MSCAWPVRCDWNLGSFTQLPTPAWGVQVLAPGLGVPRLCSPWLSTVIRRNVRAGTAPLPDGFPGWRFPSQMALRLSLALSPTSSNLTVTSPSHSPSSNCLQSNGSPLPYALTPKLDILTINNNNHSANYQRPTIWNLDAHCSVPQYVTVMLSGSGVSSGIRFYHLRQ